MNSSNKFLSWRRWWRWDEHWCVFWVWIPWWYFLGKCLR